MKNYLVIALLLAAAFASCSKKESLIESKVSAPVTSSEIILNQYQKYLIPKGSQYCTQSAFAKVDCNELSFKVRFDSSAVYKNSQEKNQEDINKLYGFSDNNAMHHEYSARFGWRWSNNALRLFAYVYNASVMSFKEIGTVEIGTESVCTIKVNGSQYIFKLNGTEIKMPRAATTITAQGYKLYPYFGGDETSPHDISIWIMELQDAK
jgi:hypothetical protein